jgi:hypothetical protein
MLAARAPPEPRRRNCASNGSGGPSAPGLAPDPSEVMLEASHGPAGSHITPSYSMPTAGPGNPRRRNQIVPPASGAQRDSGR